MQNFEIHITGDKSILETAKPLSFKTIVIDLLKPDQGYLRTEYMTSQVLKFDNYKNCKKAVDEMVHSLEKSGTKIERIKIECPYHKALVEDSLYLEIHFDAFDDTYPMSKNQDKENILATSREYNKDNYAELFSLFFIENGPIIENPTIEICLFDSNVKEDFDWFNLY